MTDLTSFTWQDALDEFLLHKAAAFAPKTVRYYREQLSGLAQWAAQNGISYGEFGKRHLNLYLIERSKAGKSQLTVHHDAMCAKVFFNWCAKNDLIDRNPLGE